MESGDSGVTSPVLRVTAEISEIKGNPKGRDGGKYSASPSSVASKEGRNNLFSKKKSLHPLYGYNPYQRSNYAGSYISSHQNAKNNVSSFTQRIMSAKLLRVKQLQNQLAETQLKLNEVLNENKTLRTLQQRQDTVLKKYEGNQEQLPHLLKSHHEEIRILNEKYKQLRASYRELENRAKQKDHELTNLREQYKHLLKLSRDKHLGDREKLTKKVEEMESIIEQQRSKIYALDKKLSLEEKNHRYQLNQEITKHKKTQNELNSALESINNLKSAIEVKDRFANTPYPRFQKVVHCSNLPDKVSKPSHVSLPAPPRVSIRQTQRLSQSASALQEDSETADSFTVNYSPVHRGSTSIESDNSSTGSKEEKLNSNLTSKYQNGKSRLVGSVQGGISISKEAFRKRRESRRATEKDIKEIQIKENNTGRGRSHNDNLVKVSSRENNNPTLTNDATDQDKTLQNNLNETENCVEILDSRNGGTQNEQETSEIDFQEPLFAKSNEGNSLSEADKEMNINKTDNEMKIDMDSEFEKILQSTRLTDEAISEYYKRDFRAEIFELEKKFQDLNKVSSRYLERNKKMNGESSHIPLSDGSDSGEENTNGPGKWTVVAEEELSESNHKMDGSMEKETKHVGPSLKESQKVSLLLALNNIDEASRDPFRDSIHSGITNNSHEKFNMEENIGDSEKSSNSFSRTRRKSEIMKDLFGVEGAAH